MIKPIVTDKKQLAIPSKLIKDPNLLHRVIQDLLDTAKHYQAKPIGCVGLAANQIGYLYRVIVIWHGADWLVMVNPAIEVRGGKQGLAHEACLSRPSVRRKIKRHKRIQVAYWNESEDLIQQKFSGFTARIIQHETDHLKGVFI